MWDQILAWLVIILPALFGLLIELVSKDVREHRFWKVAVVVFGIGLSLLTFYQIHRADKKADADRTNATIETSQRVSKQVTESVTRALKEQYASTINGLQLQISHLQSMLSTQGKDVAVIKGSNIVSGKQPVKVEISNPGLLSGSNVAPTQFHASMMSTTPNPQFGKLAYG